MRVAERLERAPELVGGRCSFLMPTAAACDRGFSTHGGGTRRGPLVDARRG